MGRGGVLLGCAQPLRDGTAASSAEVGAQGHRGGRGLQQGRRGPRAAKWDLAALAPMPE